MERPDADPGAADPRRALRDARIAAAEFAELLEPAHLDRVVPSCPGWTVADLARHLGGVHRWATAAVLSHPDGDPGEEPPGPAEDSEVRDWFVAGAAALIGTLDAADPDSPCWTFGPPGQARFWMRRQAHETTLHRWDLETALGRPAHYPEPLARDGIREVTEMMLPRQVRLGRLAPSPEAVRLEPAGADPVTLRTRDDAVVGASIAGTAESLLLMLWRRIGLDDPRLRISGDPSVAARVLGGALTP